MTERDTRSFIRFMMQVMPFNLENRIVAALTDSGLELWFPHLTYDLAQTGWRKLEETIKLDGSNYGTARVVLNYADARRDIIYTLLIKNQDDAVKDIISVELLPANVTTHYRESGIGFYEADDLFAKGQIQNEILDCLSAALNLIRLVPSLFETVIYLVKCIHLIKPESDEYDVSFSEPQLPFSIFVSVPQQNNLINALRVAEAIVHEAMHLQLTLIEAIVPLITNSDEKFYSPWKSEYRTAGGVLHAIYVFQVLQLFFLKLFDYYLFSSRERDYLNDRRNLIARQVAEVENFADCSALTHSGKRFVGRLIEAPVCYKYPE